MTATPQGEAAMKTVVHRARQVVTWVWLPGLLLGLWWFRPGPSGYVPALREIIDAFGALVATETYREHVVSSVTNLIVGFVIAVILGVAGGTVLALVRPVGDATLPYVNFIRSIPPVALIPLAIILLGIGRGMHISLIVFTAIFPTLLATVDGIRGVDPLLRSTAELFHLTPYRRLVHVILPAAAPMIIGGIKLTLQVSFIVMVTSEMLGATEGLGYFTIQSQQMFATLDMWVGIVTLSLIGVVANATVSLYQSRALSWYVRSNRQ